jgi:hypothetical protein
MILEAVIIILKENAASIFMMEFNQAAIWTGFVGWVQVLSNGGEED